MDFFTNLLLDTVLKVWTTFQHNWPFLLVSVLIAVALKLYVDGNKVSAFLIKYRKAGVVGATAAAVATPLCSCGTTAIILGMMAGMMPWAPIVAFMVASPLSSPEGVVYSAGLFGWPFAIAFYVASILLGLLGGAAAGFAENRGWLANQNRMAFAPVSSAGGQPERTAPRRLEGLALALAAESPEASSCGCGSAAAAQRLPAPAAAAPAACGCSLEAVPTSNPIPDTGSACGCDTTEPERENGSDCGCGGAALPLAASSCGCGTASGNAADAEPAKAKVTLRRFATETLIAGRQLLFMFFGFAFIGYFLNGLIPQEWIAGIFGSGNIYSVPLAATLGLPLYINSEASLPLVRALIDGGMSQGAAMAFLITGAGTSIGALAGALTIARWRVIALVVGTLWVGAVVMGYLYNAILVTGLV